jgi:hypothetical protein
MKKNVGSLDSVIRLVIAAILVVLFLTHVLTGTVGIILLVAGIILALTAFVSFCPIYYFLRLSTRKKTV